MMKRTALALCSMLAISAGAAAAAAQKTTNGSQSFDTHEDSPVLSFNHSQLHIVYNPLHKVNAMKFEANYSVLMLPKAKCASPCRPAEETVCYLNSRNSFSLQHFPHAAEAQLSCFSLFRRYPSRKRRIVVTREDPVHVKGFHAGNDFNTVLHGLIDYRKVEEVPFDQIRQKRKEACFVHGTPRQRNNTGPPGFENPWLIDEPGIRDLQRRAMFTTPTESIVNIGIVNRRGTRRIEYARELMGAISEIVPAKGFTVSTIDDLGDLSVQDQAQWMHNQDLVIAPHGAQNANFMWVRECTAVLELFPLGYYVPGYTLALAEIAGAEIFTGYPGARPKADTSGSFTEGVKERMKHRSMNFEDAVDKVEAQSLIEEMLKARLTCLERRLKDNGGKSKKQRDTKVCKSKSKGAKATARKARRTTVNKGRQLHGETQQKEAASRGLNLLFRAKEAR